MIFLFFTALLAFYVALNLGANDVANSMGTSVGSGAVTLRQALIIAGVLEFAGAMLLGQRVSTTLAETVVDPTLFASVPTDFALGMVAALLTCGIWLQIATTFGLPVSSSHAIVGAIAGFGWIAAGFNAVQWQSIGVISITWVLTPVVSGAIAAGLYSLVSRWIVQQPNPLQQLYEWIPWLSTGLVTVFGFIVLPPLAQALPLSQLPFNLPGHDWALFVGAIASVGLTLAMWRVAKRQIQPIPPSPQPGKTLVPSERIMARFQLLSACFVAFAHGSNDVGNAIAPLGAIAHLQATGNVPLGNLTIPLWILVVGGGGIVFGLAIWGKNVITTIGENITRLQPSSGFCAELATATTTLTASYLGLPVSTSHALVGAVVGIGFMQRAQAPSGDAIQLGTLRQIALAWFVTIPAAVGLSVVLFAILRVVNPIQFL
ncbi:inorganic phosphate transporter [Oscillatoria sp. FACHB-1407]|uniref:inorganic phosphate transporter n=1 Tax=Oscillatoria sp. FACHB-1407 TaxID=2692847 RepID=UPI001684B80A|nr:inorganic phosphate transporter [Oscillatoria sp. FACHB-1407]MBD2461142.1 inorganic phosphate transporter [Oscillatoria sp. FACHB-1407]